MNMLRVVLPPLVLAMPGLLAGGGQRDGYRPDVDFQEDMRRRKEWTLVRYTGRGTLADESGPMTLHEALSRAAAFTADD